MRLLSMLALVCLPTLVESQNVADEAKLGSLFLEQSVEAQAQVCSKRFPSTKAAWLTEVKAWKERNAAELQEMRALSLQVEASLKARNLEAQLVAFEAQALALPLYALAGYRDHEAEQFCDKLLLSLSDAKMGAQTFSDARAAAAAALANGNKALAR
jgi:hypothetical protein